MLIYCIAGIPSIDQNNATFVTKMTYLSNSKIEQVIVIFYLGLWKKVMITCTYLNQSNHHIYFRNTVRKLHIVWNNAYYLK